MTLENDNSPLFGERLSTGDFVPLVPDFSVDEEMPPGSLVLNAAGGTASVMAVDADRPVEPITLSITGSTLFEVDQINGFIITTAKIDRETVTEVEVTVTASDGARETAITFTITINDINDNAPDFGTAGDSFRAYIPEGAAVGSSPLVTFTTDEPPRAAGDTFVLLATDLDAGLNGQIQYQLVDDGGAGLFAVGLTSGAITSIGVLDRETAAEHIITVRAIDMAPGAPRASIEHQLIIMVMDENDNSPEFPQRRLAVSVKEYDPPLFFHPPEPL